MGSCLSRTRQRLKFRRRRRQRIQSVSELLSLPLSNYLSQQQVHQSTFAENQAGQLFLEAYCEAALRQRELADFSVGLLSGLAEIEGSQQSGHQSTADENQAEILHHFREAFLGRRWDFGDLTDDLSRTFAETNSPSERQQQENQSASAENLAVNFLKAYRGVELGRWELSAMIDDCSSTEPETNSLSEGFEQLTEAALELSAVPYHDQAEHLRYMYRKNHEITQVWQSFSPSQVVTLRNEFSSGMQEFLNDPDESGSLPDELNEFMQVVMGLWQRIFSRFDALILADRLGIATGLLCVEMGMRLPLLKGLSTLGPTTWTPMGENGYTMVFQGGQKYSVSHIRDHIFTRNYTPPDNVDSDIVTVAISYKHFWKRNDERIHRADLKAIASFIEASHATRIRFWIDTKLPPTDDGSFERWLTRGVRPYVRYMTLICPSAAKSTERFWLANEKHIAAASKGIFYFEGERIYFTKTQTDLRNLAKRMLTVVIGEQEVPPGVRPEDEGKVSQWALSILGSEHNSKRENSADPKIDELHIEDYGEIFAISQIVNVIRHDGPIALPLEADRTWNRFNPLIKGKLSHQKDQMVQWLGLARREDKRTVYFFHTFLLHKITERTSVVLRVRLRETYDSPTGNAIEEKVLMEIPTDELRKMVLVTVPVVCEWDVFSGDERNEGVSAGGSLNVQGPPSQLERAQTIANNTCVALGSDGHTTS